MKRYLLIAGYNYIVQKDARNWIDAFETEEELKKEVVYKKVHSYYSKGKNKGKIKNTTEHLTIHGKEYDWYEIVDLFDMLIWLNGFIKKLKKMEDA